MRAEVMKENRDEQAGRKTHLLDTFSIFSTLLLFLPSAFSFHPVAAPIPLAIALSVSITSRRPSSPKLFLCLLLLSASTPRSLLDFQREAGIAAGGIQTS